MPDVHDPRRRADDYVCYRDMVEYVDAHDAVMHAARAESLLQIGRALEKMEKELQDHESWHRDYLQTMLTQGRTNAVQVIAVVCASLLSAASLVVAIVATLKH